MADVSMFTAEELRVRAQKRRRLVIGLALLLALGIGTYFAARPTRNAIKGWQARRHAKNAFALIAAEQWKEAKDEAVAAYQLRQSEPEALRAVARLLSRTRQGQALEFWDQLANQTKLTREDFRDEAAIAIVGGDQPRAETAVRELTAAKDPAAGDWLLAAQFAMQRGDAPSAVSALQSVFTHSAVTRREQLQAAVFRLRLPAENAEQAQVQQTETWHRIEDLANGEDDVSLDSLVLLAQRTLATPGDGGQKSADREQSAQDRNQTADVSGQNDSSQNTSYFPLSTFYFQPDELVRRLESHPLAKAPQKLLALDLLIHGDPTQKAALIQRAITDWKDADAPSLAALATWLNGKGEFQRQLDTISLERAVQTRELFLQHVDALGALGRWEEIQKVLEAERFPLDPVIQRMYLARCNAQLGNPAAAENNWQRALEAAAGDVGKLMTLAEYAEKNGASDIADSAYSAAATAVPKLRPAQQGKLRMAQAAKDTKRMHAVLAEMLTLWPNDISVQNDEAYTRLLLLPLDTNNEQLITIEQLATDLVRREPASLPHRTLLALARLRQGRAIAALQAYENITVAPNSLTASALAVHATVLSANGHTEDARVEIAKVPVELLLPEEQAGIADLRE